MIKIFNNAGGSMDVKSWLFPGGEVGVKLDSQNLRYLKSGATRQWIVARIQSMNDLFALGLVKDALTRISPLPTNLFMPYVPYGRQDRVCADGESFSVVVLANFINTMGFDKVTIIDPHSDITPVLIRNCNVVSRLKLIRDNDKLASQLMSGELVSPDAGSNKKTMELAGYFGRESFVRADKIRDCTTGAIKETVIMTPNPFSLVRSTAVIVDDICDGGKTFTELAMACRRAGANKVVLFVTHGIFSKGTEILYESGIDEINTTNSFYDTLPSGVDINGYIANINEYA
jgi:ribose-phosphate pyrophosphokinase